ncbi:MAG: prolipoprotein diacylglyceryl transferase [Planctomyces sp.]|jgi:phosphatidylglycerol:prolipoprotein diacylglycerol transferase
MRTVLLRFVFEDFWQWQSVANEFHIGAGWLLILFVLTMCAAGLRAWLVSHDVRQAFSAAGFWMMFPAAILAIRILRLPVVSTGIPVFGYGFMLFVGFTSATALASSRIRQIGQPPDVIWDLMLWILIPGLIGARVNFLLAEGRGLLATKQGFADKLVAAVALWDGGIVFYGCVAGGIIGLLVFCWRRGISPLPMCDVLAPSLFLGEGFGRIGCFLYGCCFGRSCDLPWAVRFPQDSLTWSVLSRRIPSGVEGLKTIPLHPTQLYSSAAAFLLAGVLSFYFRRRSFDGAVLGLAWILYPVNRFVLETFRDDTTGLQLLGITLPLGQWVSVALLLTGIPAMLWFAKRGKLTGPNPRRL